MSSPRESAPPHLAERVEQWFGGANDRSRDAAFQRRFLLGGGFIGLVVSLVTLALKMASGEFVTAWLTAGFAVVLFVLMLLLRLGVAPAKLGWANLAVLAAHLFLWAIRGDELQREDLAWLSLLPIGAALMSWRSQDRLNSGVVPGALLALAVGGAILGARAAGLTLHEAIADRPIDTVISFAMFVVIISALIRLFERLLSRAESENRALRSLLPVCAWCREIRQDDGAWQPVERYLLEQGTKITHTICPRCELKHFDDKG